MRSWVLYPLLLLLPLMAEGEEWCGIVCDSESGKAIPMVQVLLLDEEHRVLDQRLTGADGSVCVTLPQDLSGLSLRFALLGYSFKEVDVQTLLVQGTREIQLRPQDFDLPEVKVEAKAIEEHGDTITYRSGAFTQPLDTSLEDLLVRMPDLSVTADGLITYKGRSINRFYIEDLDLLGSRYTLAARNIRPEDVAAVQVYRNHEPIRMLREQSHSDRAALNVKLKESAKQRWLTDIGGAIGGFPLIGKLNASLMNFRPKQQTIIVAKADNTGDDIIFETRVQDIGMGVVFNPYELSGGPKNLFDDRTIHSTFFGRDRRRDNQTAFLSVNHLISLGESGTLRFNLNGFHDSNRLREEQDRQYYDPILGAVALSETTDYLSRRNATENEVTYEQNSTGHYLKNILSIKYHHLSTQDAATVTGQEGAEEVRMRLPSLDLANSLTAKKQIGGHFFTLSAALGYSRKPQTMTISGEGDYALEASDLTASVALEGTFGKGSHQFTPNLQVGIEGYALTGSGEELTAFSFHNKEYRSDLSLQYRYRSGALTLQLTPHLGMRHLDLPSGRLNHLLPALSSSLRHEGGSGSTFLSLGFRTFAPGVADYFPYLTRRSLTDYDEGITDAGVSRSYSAMIRREGTLPWELTYMVTGSLNRSTAPRLATLSIATGRRISGYTPTAVSSDNGSIRGELSKYFSGPMVTLKAHGGYTRTAGQAYQQGAMIPFTSSGISYGGSLNWMGSTFITLDYTIDAAHSGASIRGEEETLHRMMRLEQTLRSTLLLGPYWGLSVSLQHNYDRSPEFDPIRQLFIDGSIYFAKGKVRLQADLTNLTNIRSEYYNRTDGINTFSRRTALRGREILVTLTLRR